MREDFFEEDFFEDDTDQSLDPITQSIHKYVKECIDKFFEDKSMHCGGKIPKYMVTNEKKVLMVVSTSLIDSVDIAYECMRNISEEDTKTNGDIATDIKMVNESLSVIGRAGVPQRFAGGMMLMYLKYVKGIQINV